MCGKLSKEITKVNIPSIEKYTTKQGKEIIKDHTKLKFNKYDTCIKTPFIISADIKFLNLPYQGCDKINDKRLRMINYQRKKYLKQYPDKINQINREIDYYIKDNSQNSKDLCIQVPSCIYMRLTSSYLNSIMKINY